MTTYLLVHDLFQGGWVWHKVVERLRAYNHRVYVLTMTGCGERRHLQSPKIDLHTYIRDVINLLHFEELRDAVVVSHGYASMATSAALQTMPQTAAKLVHIDAVIPLSGKSYVDLVGEWLSYVIDIHHEKDGQVIPWESVSFGIELNEEREWFTSRLVPFSQTAFTTPFPGLFDDTLFDRHHICCTDNSGPMGRRLAENARGRGWRCHDLACGGLPMIIAADALSQLLITLGD